MKRQVDMTPEELEAQELEWARQLYDSRVRFIEHVRKAIYTSSPTRRRALYEQWRKDYGDDIARSYAKYAEACIGGQVSLKPIEKMVERGRP